MEEKNKSKLTRLVFRVMTLTILGFFATMIVACNETEKPNYQKEATMRNEIIAYWKAFLDSGGKGPHEGTQVDVTHVVEKYIKIGDSYETAKEILLKNGFSVREYSVEEARNTKVINCRECSLKDT